MKPRPFLVLAGGTYQLPLIHAVKRRGMPVVLFDGSDQAPGFRFADEGMVVDIADPDAVVEAARRVDPAAIAAIVSEVSVRSVAAAASALGLPGISPETADACTDKLVMRTRFAAAGLPCPPFVGVARGEDPLGPAESIGFPLVIKPVDSSGSRGVRRVETLAEVVEAVELAWAQSRQRRAILEGFMDGVECTVETFTVNGQTEILGVSDKVRLPFPNCVSINLTYPPYFDAATRTAVGNAAIAALQAAGLENGPGHTEVMLTADGPVIVEIAARGGGYRIFSDILPALSGVDPVEAVIDQALGQTPVVTPTRSRAAVLRFFNPSTTGLLRAITGLDEAKRHDGVLDVVVEAGIGAMLRGITRDGERPGYIIAVADDRAAAVAAADRAEQTVAFHLDA